MEGIDYFTLSRLPIKFKMERMLIFNKMYVKNFYLADWKKAFVHLIRMTNGKEAGPISLTFCLCKLFETMVKKQTTKAD